MKSMYLLITVLIIKCMCFLAKNAINEKCDLSLKKCTVRMPCGLALHDYRISCKRELYGLTEVCSELCQLAIISLSNTAEGYDYLNCDCADNTYCYMVRNRTKFCYPKVDPVNKSCRILELYCKADESCVEAWNYYRYLCKQTFTGKECTKRCNNSLSILMRNKVGVNTKDCSCDQTDSSYDNCRTEQINLQKLCFGTELTNKSLPSGANSNINRLFFLNILLLIIKFIII